MSGAVADEPRGLVCHTANLKKRRKKKEGGSERDYPGIKVQSRACKTRTVCSSAPLFQIAIFRLGAVELCGVRGALGGGCHQ